MERKFRNPTNARLDSDRRPPENWHQHPALREGWQRPEPSTSRILRVFYGCTVLPAGVGVVLGFVCLALMSTVTSVSLLAWQVGSILLLPKLAKGEGLLDSRPFDTFLPFN